MIKYVQIDVNGLCNAKCWFCPVAYLGNPKDHKTNMPLETLENIFKQLNEGIGDFVETKNPNLEEGGKYLINWAMHFNEILLYPYFEELLELHRKYNIKLAFTTNGTNLTQEKTDLLKKYSDVIFAFGFNIPSFFPEEWSKYTGFNIKLFDKLIKNVSYAHDTLDFLHNSEWFSILINGVDNTSLFKNGGKHTLLSDIPNIDLDKDEGSIAKSFKKAKELFPKMNIQKYLSIADRAGILHDLNIVSNQQAISARSYYKKVVGCKLKRPDHGLFIGANGDVYICCVDFNYETVYGNIYKNSLKEIWNSTEKAEQNEKAYNGICTKCIYAEWK